MIGDCGILSSS